MSKEELQAFIEPLSEQEKQLLLELLAPVEAGREPTRIDPFDPNNPLRGSVLWYDDPFGPACDPDDWEVLRDSD